MKPWLQWKVGMLTDKGPVIDTRADGGVAVWHGATNEGWDWFDRDGVVLDWNHAGTVALVEEQLKAHRPRDLSDGAQVSKWPTGWIWLTDCNKARLADGAFLVIERTRGELVRRVLELTP